MTTERTEPYLMVRDTRKADKIPVFKGLTELGGRQKVRSPISIDL